MRVQGLSYAGIEITLTVEDSVGAKVTNDLKVFGSLLLTCLAFLVLTFILGYAFQNGGYIDGTFTDFSSAAFSACLL